MKHVFKLRVRKCCAIYQSTLLEGRNGLIIAKIHVYVVRLHIRYCAMSGALCFSFTNRKLVQISCFWWPYAFGDTTIRNRCASCYFRTALGVCFCRRTEGKSTDKQTKVHTEGWMNHFDAFIVFCCMFMTFVKRSALVKTNKIQKNWENFSKHYFSISLICMIAYLCFEIEMICFVRLCVV